MSQVVTRFAPSPTGFLHVGSVRTALFSYLYARKHAGKYILRVEDTDRARSTKEYEQNILDGLKWLNLAHDEFYRQSDRKGIYKEYLEKLISDGAAYISKEKVEKEGDREEVIRFKNPNKVITFNDAIRGEISFDTTELKDFIIAKSLEEPVFHFVVVLDDYLMGITHVIRGEDHISNTPRQILIQEALGAPRPTYAHLPLILAEDKSKLSKRKHGERVSLKYYIDQGFLPEAIINYLALLGWNPGNDQELFTLSELADEFDLAKVQKSGAVFNEEKLRWINKEHIKKLSLDALHSKMKDVLMKKYPDAATEDQIQKFTPVILERISTFGELQKMVSDGEFEFLFSKPDYETAQLLWKGQGDVKATALRLKKLIELLDSVPAGDYTHEKIKNTVWEFASAEGRGEVLWPMRYALSGREKSPDPFVLAALLGKDETLQRLKMAVDKASNA